MSERASSDQLVLAWLAAVGAAALLPSLIMAAIAVAHDGFDASLVGNFVWFMAIAVVVGFLHLLIAIPLFRFIGRRVQVTWLMAALCGVAIGAIPLMLVFMLSGADPAHPGSWVPSALFGAAGLAGGLAFRAVLGKREPQA